MNPELSSTDRPVDAVPEYDVLARIAAAVQPTLRAWLDGEGPLRTPVKDALHGTFVGHPLHPILTDVPVGAWTVAAVCDLLDLAGAHRYRDAADVAIVIGALGATGAAATGLADWSDTKDEPQRLGVLHALVNGGALSCYLASLLARGAGARGVGVASALLGFGTMVVGAYLGGELSFGMQLGVKHTAVPIEPPDQFVPALRDADLPTGTTKPAQAAGVPLLVSNRERGRCAVGGVCTHRGAPLAEGTFEDGCVRCPWHGSRFALDDGHVVEGPATFPLASYETRIVDGTIAVRAKRRT